MDAGNVVISPAIRRVEGYGLFIVGARLVETPELEQDGAPVGKVGAVRRIRLDGPAEISRRLVELAEAMPGDGPVVVCEIELPLRAGNDGISQGYAVLPDALLMHRLPPQQHAGQQTDGNNRRSAALPPPCTPCGSNAC